MTPPPPSSPANGQPPRRGRAPLYWGAAGLVVALGAAAFILLGGRARPGASHGHEGHDEHGHGGAARQAPAKKFEASMEVLRHTDRAARAAATGNRAKARESLGEALMLAPDFAPALLVHVCLALEEGNDAEAGTALEKLKAAAPGSPEVALLERLREARRTAGTSWQQAFREAWVALGRPDLEKSALLPGATPLPPDPAAVDEEKAAWERATSDDVKLMLALAARRLDAEKALFLLKQVPRLEDPALYLAVRDALRGDALPESSFAEARDVFREKLEALAKAHPNSLQLQLLLLLGDTEQGAALTAAELDALEKLAAMTVWRETSFAATYQQARRRLVEAGVVDASALALGVATRSISDRGTWLVRTRSISTRGELTPEGRQRLGRITRDLGTRLVGQPVLMERMAGLQLVRSGSQDMGDELGVKLALAQLDGLDALVANFRKTAMARWPLHALTEELMEANTRDEPGYLQSFMPVREGARAAGTQP